MNGKGHSGILARTHAHYHREPGLGLNPKPKVGRGGPKSIVSAQRMIRLVNSRLKPHLSSLKSQWYPCALFWYWVL